MNHHERKYTARARLHDDFESLVGDLEDYLSATVGQTQEAYAAARAKLENSVRSARARLSEAREQVAEKTRAASHATDAYVHENPWPAIAAGAGLGLLVGLLLSRR